MSAPAAIPAPDQAFLLPRDVLFVPLDELAPAVRGALGDAKGHLAVTRPGFRVPARLVDEPTAGLLGEFRSPCTIADAVVRFSARRGLDAERTLDDAFPMLQLFSASFILVPEGSPQAAGVPVSWAPGQVVGGFEIAAVLQSTLDSEVYRARTADGCDVALKVEQENAPAGTADALLREEDALRCTGAGLAPRVVAAGLHRGRRFLALAWFDGVPVTTRAAEIRHRAAPGWRDRLHRLACGVVDAFRRVHALGIVHGDVHPRNVLAGAGDAVHLIDFGMSRQPGRGAPFDHDGRTGFGWYLDPDAVRPLLAGSHAPPPDAASEAYAVAALVYEVLTGERYLAFAPEVEAAYRQILADPPLPFARRGAESWPAVEAVLRRALAKDARARYPSTAAFALALRCARPPRPRALAAALERRSTALVARFAPPAPEPPPSLRALFATAPVAANDHGAGGLAWFLYRTGVLRERPDLLALADVWSRRAVAALDAPDAFHTPASEPEHFRIGACSVLHRAAGVYFVRALIAQARADDAGLHAASGAFLDASAEDGGVIDVTLGRAGSLLAGAALWRAAACGSSIDTQALAAAVERGFEELAGRLDAEPPGLVARQPLSFAHGFVGILYALLRAAAALGRPLPAGLPAGFAARLDEVVGALQAERAAESAGAEHAYIPGWCNGAAGHVPLLILAGEVYGRRDCTELAEWAAERAASHPDRHAHLCCGLAGRVFAFLHMYRHTGASRWLARARSLAPHLAAPRLPVEGEKRAHSLFWGPLGCALALEELRHPEWAAMPIVGDLGWPAP